MQEAISIPNNPMLRLRLPDGPLYRRAWRRNPCMCNRQSGHGNEQNNRPEQQSAPGRGGLKAWEGRPLQEQQCLTLSSPGIQTVQPHVALAIQPRPLCAGFGEALTLRMLALGLNHLYVASWLGLVRVGIGWVGCGCSHAAGVSGQQGRQRKVRGGGHSVGSI